MDPLLLDQLLDIQNPHVNSSQNSISYGREVDIWSLGCICYELYFGKSIFEGQNLHDIVNEVKNHQLIINSKASSEFFEFLRNMLQYNKFNRLSAKKLKSLPFLTKDVKMFKILQINEKIEKPFELFGIKDSIALYKEKMKKKKGNI
jgi:serine/threonine protein kinase